ncbi:hypothetical protein D3C81_1822960 [compost metagenome]
MLAPPMLAAQQLQTLERCTGQCRWLAGGVDVWAGKLDHAFDQVVAARDKGTRSAEGLAQGADQDRHIILAQTEVLDDPAAIGA